MYKDDEDDVPVAPPPAKKTAKPVNMQMMFMQTQLAQKKAAMQQQAARQKIVKPAGPAPVIDLSTRNRSTVAGSITTISSPFPSLPAKTFQPIRANPVAENISFLPKTATDESVLIFGEEYIKCEYYPMTPNNFEVLAKELNERKQKEKAAREIAKRLAREHEEEDKKRTKGAAIAPPTMLLDEPMPELKEKDESKPISSFMPPPSFLPAFGKATSRGLGIAANIMKKHGYREGQGLGKSEQGMSTALTIEKTGIRGGNIVGEAPKAPTFATNSMEAVQNATKIIQLWNLTDVSEVTTEEGKNDFIAEMKEEMEKCGQVVNVIVHLDESQEEEGRRVRVFVEFTNSAQAIKAFVMMNGRFFGGRSVSAGFQNVDDYNSRKF